MSIDLVPEVVAGRFRISRELGRGGMARVYLADDEKLDRAVALKIVDLRTDLDGRGRERLLREARRAAALNHPNVVQIHDVGADDERAYIVMEHVEGTTLQQVLDRQGAVEPARAVDIAVSVCDALAAAHQLGIVHRDIKPSNILIDPDGRVKVTDFGIARANAGDTLTEEQPLGTAHYIAPEQLLSSDVDARADLYALGAVLYELVVGRPAFEGGTAAALAFRRLHVDAPDPAEHATIPPGLAAVIRRCLARDRDQRYRSAEELRAVLASVATASPDDTQPLVLTAEEELESEPAADRATRRRRFALLALAALLVAAVGTGTWWRAEFGAATSVTVPDLGGMSLGDAVTRLHERGLRLGGVVRIPGPGSGDVVRLEVYDQDPEPGASVPRGTEVHLEVAVPDKPPTSSEDPVPRDGEGATEPDGSDRGTSGGAGGEDADRKGNAPPGHGGVPPGKGGDPPGKGGND